MILFRYLCRESLTTMVAVTLALMAIIMSGRFVKYLADVSAGKLAPDFLFLIMFYRLPNFLEMILPLGLFIGILLAYGRLYVDSEMTVMKACGISRERLMVYTLVPALGVAAVVGTLSLVVSPKGVLAYERLLQESDLTEMGLKTQLEGRFRMDGRHNRVTYIERVARDGSTMRGVFLAEGAVAEDGRHKLTVVVADRGYFEEDPETGQRFLVMEQGHRFFGEPGVADHQLDSFERFGQWLQEIGPRAYRDDIDSQSTAALLASDDPEARAALYWRISLALLVPVAALMALSLSRTSHRSGRYNKLFPAFVLYMIYLVTLNAARDAMAQGEVGAAVMMALHLVFLVVALALLYLPDLLFRWRARGN